MAMLLLYQSSLSLLNIDKLILVHVRFSHVCHVTPLCTHIGSRKPKMVAVATALSCNLQGIGIISILSADHSNPLHNQLTIAVVHTKLVIAISIPKLVAMSTTLRDSISAMSSSDMLTQKNNR